MSKKPAKEPTKKNVRKKSPIFLIIITILTVISLFAVAILLPNNGNQGFFNNNDDNWNPGNYTFPFVPQGVSLLPPIYIMNPQKNPYTDDYRPIYANMTPEQYKVFFDELPKIPKDFYETTKLISEQKLTNFDRLGPEYWKQPEFYPGWLQSVDGMYIHNNPYEWIAHGYGCYPAAKHVETFPGATFESSTFFMTGYGVETYQGIILSPKFPKHAVNMIGETVFDQDPEKVSKWFDVSIVNPKTESWLKRICENLTSQGKYINVDFDREVLCVLKPTYTKYADGTEDGFPADWAKKVTFKIKVSPDCPKGNYCLILNFRNPSEAINEEMYWIYKLWYTPAVGYYVKDIPYYQLIITVK